MRTPLRERVIPLGLAALAFVIALVQRPGMASSDTKIDLHVDPVGFLADVASAWSPTGDLGHVQGGQYGGYLFPMGPFFALGRLLGLSPWLVQRLWLAAILAMAAWGTVRLLDALYGRPRGVAHAVAGLLVLVNPYVVVFTARTTVTLLGYAALPWLLLCVHRALRAPRGWWWPAAFALVVTFTGGGVNAAVTAWVLLGPVLLALYERWAGGVDWRAVWGATWRTALVTALASAWWVVPLLVQSLHGVDFLAFTEQPGTIWSTTSLPESLRLMGYWISYLGVGYQGVTRPYFSDGGTMLFFVPEVLASLLVPALALAGLVWTRRWRYGPFFAVLVLVGVAAMAAGFPEGTPLRKGLTFAYNHIAAGQFLRTTYKAGPLVALGIAALGGAAAARVAAAVPRAAATRVVAAGALAALVALAAWPLATGRALDDQLLWKRIPGWWTQAAGRVDADGDGTRALVLPGQLYAYYGWGGTIDPILPSLADRPVAERTAVPYADLRASDLLWEVDDLVQQGRSVPGQLGPLLDLMSAGTVVSAADDDPTRSGAAPAAAAADLLDGELGRPSWSFGPVATEPAASGTLAGDRRLPRVRAWERRGARPLVRLEPDAGATVVDGSAAGVADLAAMGPLPRRRLAYAADLDASALRRAAAGGQVVITDSNRRQVLVPSLTEQSRGAVLAPGDPISEDAAVLDPWPGRGTAAQTVAELSGVRAVRAPFSPNFAQFPERRPFAAIDGDPSTAWVSDRNLDRSRHWLEVTFDAPRDVPSVDLRPYSDSRGRVTQVEAGGRRFAVHPGWNHLVLGLRQVPSLRVRITNVVQPATGKAGPGGIRELRIPGVHAVERLRPPVLAESALAGRDLSHTGLTYLFSRTTGDEPFRRDPRHGPAGADLVADRGDGERGLQRVLDPPAARTWRTDGWASAAAGAPDPALDRLAGTRGGTFSSADRFEGVPGRRASSAFDGTPRAWIGSWLAGQPAWLAWSTPRASSVRRLRLAPPREDVRRPTLVRLRWASGASPPLRVGADGTVTLPQVARGRSFRLEILASAFPPGTPARDLARRAVGIAEITGAGVPRARVPRSGPIHGRCGDLAGTLGGRPLAMRVEGDIRDLDAGRPLRVRGCGEARLPAGPADLSLSGKALAPYLLRLRSPAPVAGPAAASAGRVVSPGALGRDDVRGIRLDVRRPAWLVLGEAYDDAWRATCDGRDLGAPVPVDAASMGWRVPAGCRSADLSFSADGTVRAGYAVSIVVLAALLALLLVRRHWRVVPAASLAPVPAADAPARVPARRAAAIAVAAGLVLGFVLAARYVPVLALAVYVVLRRGIGARPLLLAGAGLLVVAVPVLTLAIPATNHGGFGTDYPSDRIAVHWVTAAGLVLVLLALVRTLLAARPVSTARERPAGGRAGAPAGAAEPAPAP